MWGEIKEYELTITGIFWIPVYTGMTERACRFVIPDPPAAGGRNRESSVFIIADHGDFMNE
ncbi:MAG: hypothetical protein WC299_01055 [Kiritimatiellia bacterium]